MPKDAPHIGKRVAGVGRDRRQRRPVDALRVGGRDDVVQAAGDRGVQVAGDPHPLLLGRGAGVALAVALQAQGALHEAVLQQRLPAHPPAGEQRHRDRDESQHHVPDRIDRGVGERARRGDHHDAQRRAHEPSSPA